MNIFSHCIDCLYEKTDKQKDAGDVPFKKHLGSGCDSVGRVVASDNGRHEFEFTHCPIFIPHLFNFEKDCVLVIQTQNLRMEGAD